MTANATVTFTKATRRAVAAASDHGPSLGIWLDRIRAIASPALTDAIEGIWCGHSGEARIDLVGANSMLCVGWHNGRVEWSYIS